MDSRIGIIGNCLDGCISFHSESAASSDVEICRANIYRSNTHNIIGVR